MKITDRERLDWLEGEIEREKRESNIGRSLFRRNRLINRESIDKNMKEYREKWHYKEPEK